MISTATFATTTYTLFLSNNKNASCSSIVEVFRKSFHAKLTLGLAGLAGVVLLIGVLFLVVHRNHRAMRASGMELSSCVMAAAALRIAALVLIALAPRTVLCCVAMTGSAVLSTSLTFTAIALKVCSTLINTKHCTVHGRRFFRAHDKVFRYHLARQLASVARASSPRLTCFALFFFALIIVFCGLFYLISFQGRNYKFLQEGGGGATLSTRGFEYNIKNYYCTEKY
jgi:hypothetical protein